METIERTPPRQRMNMPTDDPFAPQARPQKRWPLRLWRETMAFVTIALIGLGVGGLTALRDAALAGWTGAFSSFRWTVLVTGDRIELDEIGRYLRQLDGVGNVTHYPAEAIVDRLRREPLLQNHVGAIEASELPSIWEIAWTSAFDTAKIDETITDIRRLPGVVDIVYDSRELDKIGHYRASWLSIRVLLSALALAAVLALAILLGRFFFFTDLSRLGAGRAVWSLGAGLAAWSAGLAAAAGLIGPFSWHLAWAGFAAGAVRVAAAQCRPVE